MDLEPVEFLRLGGDLGVEGGEAGGDSLLLGRPLCFPPVYGNGDKPSSFRNSLCFVVALRIASSISTSSACVAARSISDFVLGGADVARDVQVVVIRDDLLHRHAPGIPVRFPAMLVGVDDLLDVRFRQLVLPLALHEMLGWR